MNDERHETLSDSVQIKKDLTRLHNLMHLYRNEIIGSLCHQLPKGPYPIEKVVVLVDDAICNIDMGIYKRGR